MKNDDRWICSRETRDWVMECWLGNMTEMFGQMLLMINRQATTIRTLTSGFNDAMTVMKNERAKLDRSIKLERKVRKQGAA